MPSDADFDYSGYANETVRFDSDSYAAAQDATETLAHGTGPNGAYPNRRQLRQSQAQNQLPNSQQSGTAPQDPNPAMYTRAYSEDYAAGLTNSGSYERTPSGNYSSTATGNITGSHERVISQMHRHPRRLFLPALITIAAPAAVAYLYGTFEYDWENILILVAGLIVVVLFGLLPLLFWLSTNYTITTRRIVIRRGLLTQIRQELLHSRSYDITVRRGPIQRLFGSGDVEINAGLDQPIVLKNIPDVVLVQQVLQELMERSASSIAQRRQRGAAQHGR